MADSHLDEHEVQDECNQCAERSGGQTHYRPVAGLNGQLIGIRVMPGCGEASNNNAQTAETVDEAQVRSRQQGCHPGSEWNRLLLWGHEGCSVDYNDG